MNILLLAALAFNPLFSDHAVLQRDRELTVWGDGAVPGERLTLTFAGSTTWTKANRDGSFRFLLPAQKAGGPFELKAFGEKSGTAVAADVLVGEVWLCSGQSNMEFLMKSAEPGWGDRTDAQLRCYRTPHQYGFGPCAESRSDWRIATPANVQQFTAVGAFFGAALRRELGVPVGLLFSAHGGTVVEAWSSREALQSTAAGRKALQQFASAMSDAECWKPLDEIGAKTWPKDPGPSAEALGWAKPDDASAGWRPVPVPSMFQELENRRFNGAVWYRRDLELPTAWKGRDLVLTIPAVDKHDRTYANGALVGATGSGFDTSCHDKKRVYRIPAALVNDGRVRLAIRVWSHIYGGGICGFGEDFRLGPDGERGIAVDGTWQAKIELDVGRTGALPMPKVAGNCNIPHALFDSKILPLIPFGIRGAIWYQGESNQGNASEYHDLLSAMVKDWRYRWGQGDFPFVSVQLAAFLGEKPFVKDDAWSEIRQAMLDLSRELPNFGIASALDVGNAQDIHPKDKLTVGERLAAWTLHHTYGREDVVATGPRPRACWTEDGGLVVRFTDVGDGLVGLSDGSVRGIYVSDGDGAFHAAKTTVAGPDRLRVETDGLRAPQEVRYAWAENPGAVDLRNSAGLPASPFRLRVGDRVAVEPETRTLIVPMLEGEHWWGEATYFGSEMPFDAQSNVLIDIRADGYANQYQSLLVSDRGRYVWCDEQTALTVSGGVMRVVSNGAKIEVVKAGETLREAFLAASKAHFPPSGRTPDLAFYAAPQYCTWIELTYNQNEKDILDYAQSMLDHGLPPGILMIDDTWQAGYGDWRFEPSRFRDPKGMVEKLHAMGFKVLLWMCPFVQSDSPAFRLLTTGIDPNTVVRRPQTGGLLLGKDWAAENPVARPASAWWWNGQSALVDFTDPVGYAWYKGECDRLVREFGVDGFKMDGGHLMYYSRGYRAHADVSSGLQAQAYGRLCLDYPVCEFRNAYQLAGQPIVERLNDKGHSWSDLRKCVTDLIAGGLLGYSFMCPDMIGGGQWVDFLPGAKFDDELFVRSCQMQALCGMMQFSASPWRMLDEEKQEIVRRTVALRQRFAPRFVELAKACGRTGEPFLRSLEYEFPHRGYAAVKDQFLIGDFLLVAPQLEKGAATRTVEIPEGTWMADDGTEIVGPKRVTVATPLCRLPYFERCERAAAEDGWEMLFDGRSTAGWVSVTNTSAFPSCGWEIRDGALSVVPTRHFLPDGNAVPTNGGRRAQGGDICTVRKFRDFHLKAEFRLTPQANGGIKYFFEPDRNGGTALEYQVLDPDYPTPPGTTPEAFATKRVASAYLLYAADAEKYLKPCGEWNQAEIVARGRQVEHWLNGVKVVSFTRGSADFWSRFATTKWANAKYNANGDWGCAESGRIQLQDHQDAVSYRNIMIRELEPEPPQPFVLAKDGVCRVRFVCDSTPGEVFATNDFVRILSAITGEPHARTAAMLPSNAIVFRIDPALGPRDAFRVDTPDAHTLMVQASNSRSVVFAMDAVWEALGCRWFWPGKDGEYLPAPTKDLALPAGFACAESTPFAFRHLKGPDDAASVAFFAHNRLNPLGGGKLGFGQSTCWGGHSFGHIVPADCRNIKEYYAKCPEQFALVDGIRVNNQHCYTNPDTIRTFQDWICRFWEKNPDIEYLKLTPLDCPNRCHCADCSKTDESTAFWTFLSEIVKPAREKHPRGKYCTYAYMFYRPVPKCPVDPEMLVQYCLYNRCYKHGLHDPGCPVNAKALVEVEAWRRHLGRAPELFGYHWDVFGGAGRAFYQPLASVLADEIRWAADLGISYWHTEYPSKRPAQVSVRHPAYVAARLMWNPKADAKAVTADFCSHVFGDAAPEMAAYYDVMETAWRGEGHLSYYGNSPASVVGKMISDETLARVDRLFASAEAKLAAPEAERARKELAREKEGWLKWRELKLEKVDPEVWEMTVPKAVRAPNMDGTGTDGAWDAGKVCTAFKTTWGKVKKSEATVLHDGKALYLRFRGYDDDMDSLKLLTHEHDGNVSSDDGIEMCLDPNNTRTDYYWLCVNADNVTIDALASVGMNINRKWEGRWRTAASKHADHWVIEVEMPFATFGEPQPGKPWLWGLNRSHTRSSWTDGAFHSPNSFRVVHLEGLN